MKLVRSLTIVALSGLWACADGGAGTTPTDSVEEELSAAGTCDQQLAVQEAWEDLLIGGGATEVVREDLPPRVASYADRVIGSDMVFYRADVGGAVTFAVTWAPEHTDTVLGEVTVFNESGVRLAKGSWGDSPQIYWRGRCRRP